MAELNEEEIRNLFQAMDREGSSTNNLATTGRSNRAEPFDGDGFLNTFEEMLEPGLEITAEAYKKFGV